MQTFLKWLETNYTPWGTPVGSVPGEIRGDYHKKRSAGLVQRYADAIARNMDFSEIEMLMQKLQSIRQDKDPIRRVA